MVGVGSLDRVLSLSRSLEVEAMAGNVKADGAEELITLCSIICNPSRRLSGLREPNIGCAVVSYLQ